MAIAPIDLQTLFSQVDKVGRTQSAEREGHAVQQSMQGIALQKKDDEHVRQVNETQNTGEGAEKINDNSKKQNSGAKGDRRKNEEQQAEEEQKTVLSDPFRGRKIDITL